MMGTPAPENAFPGVGVRVTAPGNIFSFSKFVVKLIFDILNIMTSNENLVNYNVLCLFNIYKFGI